MRIIIEGTLKEGKSTVAQLITEVLKAKGITVNNCEPEGFTANLDRCVAALREAKIDVVILHRNLTLTGEKPNNSNN